MFYTVVVKIIASGGESYVRSKVKKTRCRR